jgi:DNA repair protein RadC
MSSNFVDDGALQAAMSAVEASQVKKNGVGRPKVFNAQEVIDRRREYAKRYYHEKKKIENNKISLKGLAKIIKEEASCLGCPEDSYQR